jgi:hypothetical protein
MVSFHGGGREHMGPLAIQFTLENILFLFFPVSEIWKEFNKKIEEFVKFTIEKQKFPKQILVFSSKNGEFCQNKKHYSKRISCP